MKLILIVARQFVFPPNEYKQLVVPAV